MADLVARVFNADVAPGYSQEGIDEFLSYASPDKLRNRFGQDHFVLIAQDGQRMAGAIEVRANSHISLFFVEPTHQRLGIGRELLRRALQKCRAQDQDLQSVSVNSSPNAVEAYEQFGFHAQDSLQIIKGIAFVPMTLALEPSADEPAK